jgi:predicted N-acyltransferase
MDVVIAESMAEFGRAEWNELAGDRYPFLRHEFLRAAEQSGSVGAGSGWTPRHVGIRDAGGELVAAVPLYEKSHSWGEFVFDWSWAHAYERAGVPYYPKLVSTVPFTPATSRRLLYRHEEHVPALTEAMLALARDRNCSSIHVLFPEEAEIPRLEQAGMMIRKDCQFHWRNRNYRNFDDFLATFNAAKRKKARQDRRIVADQGIRFRRLTGREMDPATWSVVYELISITFLRRGSMPYFSFDFFLEVSAELPDNLLVVLAERVGQPIAAAVFYVAADTLYGRYWGADGRYNGLHFETCYYQGIDYCIEHGLERFEPGTQGEHKVARGFVPTTTWSAHWLARAEFYAAVGEYLKAESRHVDRYMDDVNAHTPYRKDPSA